ncbi:cation:proton antiporter [Orrella dioscoreae]|uniref:Putative sodium/hydrogen exchanger family n=1 Tax=Orrella dioscoreae TaxID=1851544 RepID=A0A1C3K4H3_9BURK|nr:cation:proton antiporter [Orrella dioscoreae]SBT26328.1 putative sodium/hydrogen exchanger family [Orrella dioscoreae]SOE46448.1 putative sodium/hydrogen exchanger family [Orrella dioscoreae]
MEVGFLVFGLAGLLALVCFMPPLAGRLKLPYSVLLAIVGCALGYVVHVHDWAPRVVADFLDTLDLFEISSETFLMVFLPVLLFETALAMNVRRLLDDLGPILMMAIVAVVVCTVVVGFTLSTISQYGLVVCLLLGAIVATTDPVAVVGIFREVGAPKRLTTLVEGESLFNDAASIALYSVLLAVLAGEGTLSTGAIAKDFLVTFLGGGVAGFVMGRLACGLFAWLRGWPTAEITLTLTLAYLSFFISEHYLGVSGVVATVIAGLVVGSSGRTRMSPTTFEQLSSFWEQFGFWANSLIFLFAAMLVPRLMADADLAEILLVVVVFGATLAARAIVVFGLLPLLQMLRIGQRVGYRYKSVMLWGGLRGAVSLALALAVTEQHAVPAGDRQFVAVVVTGFVLATLFINGTTLRPLIGLLGLNKLSPMENTLRNQALVVALEDLQEHTEQLAKTEHIGAEAQARIRAVFDASLAGVHDTQVAQLPEDRKVAVGLAMLAAREAEMFFDILKAQLVDWRMAEGLLARAERLGESVRANGLDGFEAALVRDLRYSRGFRLALEIYDRFGVQRWLAQSLAQRFSNLMSKRSVGQRLLGFARTQVQPLLGKEATDRIVALHEQRLVLIENALQAMTLQYPSYAEWLQEAYLGRVARELERMRYREMLEQFLISGEVYADLMEQLKARWRHIDKHPPLDMGLGADELIKAVPLFEGLSDEARQAIARLLKPRLVLPERPVILRNRHGEMMCFVASGAVKVALPDGTFIELGSGEFFGELALLSGEGVALSVTSLGYSRLLMLPARDFHALLERDPSLRERIEVVARQRLRALEVWRKTQEQAKEDARASADPEAAA